MRVAVARRRRKNTKNYLRRRRRPRRLQRAFRITFLFFSPPSLTVLFELHEVPTTNFRVRQKEANYALQRIRIHTMATDE